MNSFKMKTLLCALPVALALLSGGCGNAAQKDAYENAVKMEQPLSSDRAAAIIAEYQKVIRMEPGSEWARKAQTRIEAVQAKIAAKQKADELQKSVLQESGID